MSSAGPVPRGSIGLMLVDDHTMFRDALRAGFASLPGFRVVAEAGDASRAPELAAESQADVVLMDVAMPGPGGFEAVPEIRKQAPRAKVIMLTMRSDAASVARAMNAGASGYVTKSEPLTVLERALRRVVDGGQWIPVPTAAAARAVAADDPEENEAPLASLTPREREVFHRLVRGEKNSTVGRELGISVKTVETHRSRVLQKLDQHDLAGLVRFAARFRVL